RNELEDVLRLVHVLELVLAEVAQRDVRRWIVAQQLARRLGDEHLSPVTRPGYPRRAVDAKADVTLAAVGRLARVHAHAHTEAPALWPLVRGQVALDVERRSDSVLRTAKRREERVSLRVDLPAVVRGQGFANDLLMVAERDRVVVA